MSTASVGAPKATFMATFADLRPTPGGPRRGGARHLAAVPATSRAACRITFFALVRNSPILLMNSCRRSTQRGHSGGVGDAEEGARGLVDASVGGLRRKHHRDQQREKAEQPSSPLGQGWRFEATEISATAAR